MDMSSKAADTIRPVILHELLVQPDHKTSFDRDFPKSVIAHSGSRECMYSHSLQ